MMKNALDAYRQAYIRALNEALDGENEPNAGEALDALAKSLALDFATILAVQREVDDIVIGRRESY